MIYLHVPVVTIFKNSINQIWQVKGEIDTSSSSFLCLICVGTHLTLLKFRQARNYDWRLIWFVFKNKPNVVIFDLSKTSSPKENLDLLAYYSAQISVKDLIQFPYVLFNILVSIVLSFLTNHFKYKISAWNRHLSYFSCHLNTCINLMSCSFYKYMAKC